MPDLIGHLNMRPMKNKVLSLYDWFLIIGVIASNIIYSVLSGNLDVVGSLAGIAGVLCVVLVAKGSIWNYLFGLVNVSMYAYISYKASLYGDAVLNANYLKEKLKGAYDLPYDEPCMHEFVLSGEKQHHQGVSTLGIAKRLMDSNCHPPTVYFPLIVHEAIMIEPTESESKEVLDNFVETMLKIAREIEENPEEVLKSPQKTPIKRVDETLAARQPNLTFKE